MAMIKSLFTGPDIPDAPKAPKPPPAFNTSSVSDAGAQLRARRGSVGRASTILTLGGSNDQRRAATTLLGA